MKLIVEGGATKTIGELINTDGTTKESHTVGPTNIHVVGPEGLYKNLKKLISLFRHKPSEYHFYLSGLKSRKDKIIMSRICKRLKIKGNIVLGHDLLGGLIRRTKDGTGIIVVSGTGSAVYGRNEKGEEAQVGGMGEKLGDEGGAYSIALHGIKAAIRSHDGRGPKTILENKFVRIEDMTDWLEDKTKTEIAGLAPIVFKCAKKGDMASGDIIDNAVNNLIEGVLVVRKKVGHLKIIPTGGNFEHQPIFLKKFIQKLGMHEVRPCTAGLFGIMNSGDRTVVDAVMKEQSNIVKAIERVTNAFKNKGRLFYVGAGTSGRIAAMDAAECPPTFGVSHRIVQAITPGGLKRARENTEDNYKSGIKGVNDKRMSGKDVVIGITASGTTPFVVGALKEAKKKEAYTIMITSGKRGTADLVIKLNTGSEIVEGSTRLKAGTAAKIVLNRISTISMIKAGKTFGNLMIGVSPKNKKLITRALGIISNICGINNKESLRLLTDAGFNTRRAVRKGLEKKVKQILMFGFNKDHIPLEAGSAIIFNRNEKYLSKIKNKKIFAAVDQEGGRVNRIHKGVTILPAQGDIKTKKEAYNCGKLLARELIPLGIQIDLTPVVDVNTEPTNPIIGNRSFGSDTKKVSEYSYAMIKGMQDNGLLACAKHFPGHGATKKDSHKCLPKVDITKEEWEKVHLPPFAEAIRAGVSSIMVGHILCPALEPELPASLSFNIITGILREKMGFKGVVITDDICMGAITKHFPPEEAAVLAVNAGVDIVLVCKNKAIQSRVKTAIIDAIIKGRIPLDRINKSFDRILRMKKNT